MYNTIVASHSHLRWLVLIFGVFAIVLPLINQNEEITKKQKLPALLFLISMELQFVLGFILYFFLSPLGLDAFSQGMGHVMKTAEIRKIAVEHFTLMISAWIIVHIGYKKVKNAVNGMALKKASLVYFGICLALILAGIPWAKM